MTFSTWFASLDWNDGILFMLIVALAALLVILGVRSLVIERRNQRIRFVPNHSGVPGARQAPSFWMRDVKRGIGR